MKNILLLILSFTLQFGLSQNYTIGNFSMTIKGTSNLHDWESSCKEVRSSGDITMTDGALSSINSLNVTVPVKAIKSTKGSIMDNKTYESLKADKYANITFKLASVSALNKSGDGYSINASGDLNIAGVTKKVNMSVKGKVGSDGSIVFNGAQKIKMTDHGIKPPTALMGTMTVGDEVTIVFQVTLKRS